MASTAAKVYVCNVATQAGETDGFGVAEHIAAIEEHIGDHLIDYVVANDNLNGALPNPTRSKPVQINSVLSNGTRLVLNDVVSEANPYHHDSKKLARALVRIFYDQHQAAPAVSESQERLAGVR